MKPNKPDGKTRAARVPVTTSSRPVPPPAGRIELAAGGPRIRPEWARHYQRLLALRAQLEEQRGERLLSLGQPPERLTTNLADAATDEFDHDLALSELSAEQDAIYEIDEALARMKNGTYGRCELTGKPIPRARLNAVPWTRFTEQAKRTLEQGENPAQRTLGKVRALTADKSMAGDEEVETLPNDEALTICRLHRKTHAEKGKGAL